MKATVTSPLLPSRRSWLPSMTSSVRATWTASSLKLTLTAPEPSTSMVNIFVTSPIFYKITTPPVNLNNASNIIIIFIRILSWRSAHILSHSQDRPPQLTRSYLMSFWWQKCQNREHNNLATYQTASADIAIYYKTRKMSVLLKQNPVLRRLRTECRSSCLWR